MFIVQSKASHNHLETPPLSKRCQEIPQIILYQSRDIENIQSFSKTENQAKFQSVEKASDGN